MARKQKLELTWIGKDERPKLEPRVLIEDKGMGHAAPAPDGSPGLRDNVLIKGDNLLALKALEAEYAGKVRCVCIDPPYNTGSAFEHYNDGIEHSLWLSLLRERLLIIRSLMSDDGSIWITLDDSEAHYCKVLCDEIFSRRGFISHCIWKKRDGAPNDRTIGAVHDHIIVYAKPDLDKRGRTAAERRFNLMQRTEKANSQYRVFDERDGPDGRGPFRKVDMTANAKGGRHVDHLVFPIRNPYTGEDVYPRAGTNWRHNREEVEKLSADRRIFWGKNGTAKTPMRKLFAHEAKQGMTAPSIWDDVGLNQHASREIEMLYGEKAFFETAKPESLIKRVLEIATNPGDLVLDSFAGSGTTGAVAHKMGRRWIMVELGDHADTHIVPRLNKVIDGKDSGGVTEATGWTGGGGYRYFRLAPSLLQKDPWGQHVIAPGFKPEMLAEAVCKLMGFTYEPSQERFWQHGHSTERDFIYVTTQRLTHDALRKLSHEVGEGRTLLVCCRAHDPNTFDNLTVKKIPQAVLAKCEWGRDDYSLDIQDAPPKPITADDLDGDAEAGTTDEAVEAAE